MRELTQLQQCVDEWQQRNFAPISPHQPLLGLQEELGELAHAHLKAEQGIRGMSPAVVFEVKKDAIGDIVIYAAAYCAVNGIDLGAAVTETWAKVSQRDWKADPQNGGQTALAATDGKSEVREPLKRIGFE